jgi:hypothetical protein
MRMSCRTPGGRTTVRRSLAVHTTAVVRSHCYLHTPFVRFEVISSVSGASTPATRSVSLRIPPVLHDAPSCIIKPLGQCLLCVNAPFVLPWHSHSCCFAASFVDVFIQTQTFLSLPPEIQKHVASYALPSHISMLTSVSRGFNSLMKSEDIWQAATLSKFGFVYLLALHVVLKFH